MGAVKNDEKFHNILDENKYYFLPILNVDGAAAIEEHWVAKKEVLPRRKNMIPDGQATCNYFQGEVGIDLNRNFGIDFGQVDASLEQREAYYLEHNSDPSDGHAPIWLTKNPCSPFFPGHAAFDAVETQDFKDFLTKHQDELSFVINLHSYGNEFIYPFNGRVKNDIEERRPGILPMFEKIAKEAGFPADTKTGTAQDVMGETVGGDQDDWTLGELGIPSVTAEIGSELQFIHEW
jgi:hypothetical protein